MYEKHFILVLGALVLYILFFQQRQKTKYQQTNTRDLYKEDE